MNENTPTGIDPISTSAEVPEVSEIPTVPAVPTVPTVPTVPAVLENTSIDPPENSEISPESIAHPEISELSIPETSEPSQPTEPKPSYVKLAMRNMVRKRGKSLQHFFLTTLALLGVLVGLAYLTR